MVQAGVSLERLPEQDPQGCHRSPQARHSSPPTPDSHWQQLQQQKTGQRTVVILDPPLGSLLVWGCKGTVGEMGTTCLSWRGPGGAFSASGKTEQPT